MVTKPESNGPEMSMDPVAMYREESFTDRKVGSIRRLTPVTADGTPDPTRKILFVGQTQVLTNMGALPLSFEIEAQTLEEAVRQFSSAAKLAFEQTLKELEEMRRQSASSLVLPDRTPGGFGPGGMPGGGKLQFP